MSDLTDDERKRTLAEIEASADGLAQKFVDFDLPLAPAAFLLCRIAEDEARYDRSRSEYGYGWKHMLVECEIKRRIVAEVVDTFNMNRPPSATNSEAVWLGEAVLKLLASAYAAHPDYREEWKS